MVLRDKFRMSIVQTKKQKKIMLSQESRKEQQNKQQSRNKAK